MAVGPVYEFDVPAPYDAFFVNGEKALSVVPVIDEAPPRTTHYLSHWTWLEGGEYLLRVLCVQTSLWATSLTSDNARVFFYTQRDRGTHEAIVNLPRGMQRIDIALTNLLEIEAPCYFAASLWRQGKLIYATSAAGWVSDTSYIADADVPDKPAAKDYVPVFTLQPNWQDGMLERLGYGTEILTSESQAEQRRSLLLKPRRSFEMSFLRKGAQRTFIDSFLTSIGRNQLLLPMWHEQHRLTATLTDTVTFSSTTLALREFRAGMYALVTGKDPLAFEILTIESANLDTDTIEFTASPVGTWPAGSRLVPLRLARVADKSSLTNPTDGVGLATIRFQIDDSEPTWLSPSWGTIDRFFKFVPNRIEDILLDFDRPTAFTQQNQFGPLDVYDQDQRSRLGLSGSILLRGRKAVADYRKFLDRARGMAQCFWIPNHMRDLEPVGDIGSVSYFDISSIGYSRFYRSNQSFRSALIIEFYDKTRERVFRLIDDITAQSATVERVRVDGGTLGPIAKADIKRISFLMTVRFDQDLFEIKHHVDDSAAATTAFVVRNTNDTIPLPSEMAFTAYTSLAYPIEAIDEMDVQGVFRQASVVDSVGRLDVEGQLFEALLETVIEYKTIDDLGELDVGVVFLGATLTATIEYETASALDSLDVSASLQSASMVVVINYVNHTVDVSEEQLDVSASLLGATLE